MTNRSSRYEAVSRRAFVKGSFAAGLLALVPGLACGNNDAEILATGADSAGSSATSAAGRAASSSSAAPTTGVAAPPPTAAATTQAPTTAAPTTAAPTTAAPTTAATAAPPSSAPAALRNGFPSGGQLVVNFTFAAAAGGRVRNPYVAVWIEDATEALVQTVALWVQAGKGERWVPDLKRWYSSAGTSAADVVATTSSATRTPGAYSVAWDGSSADGSAVAAGTYFVCIEAAREHGPYELIRSPITIGNGGFELPLSDNGELTDASVVLSV